MKLADKLVALRRTYTTSLLAYDADLHDEYVNPLSSASGIIAFEVPMTVVENAAEPL